MVNECLCYNLPSASCCRCRCGCESANASASASAFPPLFLKSNSKSSESKKTPNDLNSKTFVSCNCVTTLTSSQLGKLIEDSVKNKRQTISLLIYQLNELRRELTIQSNGKTEAKFHLTKAKFELNKINKTPLSQLITLEMQNNKLREINRLLLIQFDQMKKALAN